MPPSGLCQPYKTTGFFSIFNINVQSWLTPKILSKTTSEAFWSSFVLQNLTFSLVSHDITSLHSLNLRNIQPHSWLPGYFTYFADWSSLVFFSNHTLSHTPTLQLQPPWMDPLIQGLPPVSGMQTLICSISWPDWHICSLTHHLTQVQAVWPLYLHTG